MATKQDIAKLIILLSAAFPNWSPNEYTAEVYFEDLQDIPSDELFIAQKYCRAEAGRKFAPSTGEIRGAVSELRVMSANVPSAFSAWEEVLTQVANIGSYGSPTFSNPIIDKAVRSIGWRNICLSENVIADRARFIQCYEQLAERAAKENILMPDVRGYLEENGAQLLTGNSAIKQLTERLAK